MSLFLERVFDVLAKVLLNLRFASRVETQVVSGIVDSTFEDDNWFLLFLVKIVYFLFTFKYLHRVFKYYLQALYI
jgi:hypothetical protein